jgi:hypothetical protein
LEFLGSSGIITVCGDYRISYCVMCSNSKPNSQFSIVYFLIVSNGEFLFETVSFKISINDFRLNLALHFITNSHRT